MDHKTKEEDLYIFFSSAQEYKRHTQQVTKKQQQKSKERKIPLRMVFVTKNQQKTLGVVCLGFSHQVMKTAAQDTGGSRLI